MNQAMRAKQLQPAAPARSTAAGPHRSTEPEPHRSSEPAPQRRWGRGPRQWRPEQPRSTRSQRRRQRRSEPPGYRATRQPQLLNPAAVEDPNAGTRSGIWSRRREKPVPETAGSCNLDIRSERPPGSRHAGCARRRVRRIRQHLLRRAHREGSPQAARAQVPRLFQAAGCRGIHAPAFVERSTVRRGGLGTAVNSCTSGANSGQCLDRSRTRCSTCGRCRTAR